MIVVDASIVVSGLLQAGEARDVMGRQRLSAPYLVDAEVIHVLRRRVAAGRLSIGDARQALEVWRRMGVRRYGLRCAMTLSTRRRRDLVAA